MECKYCDNGLIPLVDGYGYTIPIDCDKCKQGERK